jgi:polysaccharide pyruvyl transferase WcaK-like protein
MGLRMGSYVSWRDEASRALMARKPERPLGDVYPDLAFALRPGIGERVDRVRRIGINPMPVFDGRYWPDARADRYARYVAILAEVVAQLRDRGWEPFLFSMQPADERVMRDITAALRETASGALVPIHTPASTEALFDLLRTADLVVPTRFHGALLSLACGRPVVAIAYHRKTRDLMDSVGLGEETVALGDIGVNAIVERVSSLAGKYGSVLPRLDAAVEDHRSRLEEQFTRIARLVARGGCDLGQERVRVS